MKHNLIDKLTVISDEEQSILESGSINRDIYTDNAVFEVDSGKLVSVGRYISARTHTRFVDFPVHGHNYVEIMYVCSGNITHVIDGKEISMEAGDILFMNRWVRHGIKKAGQCDIGINFIILPEFFDIPLIMLREEQENTLADFIMGALKIHTKSPHYLHFKSRGNTAIENLMENIIGSLLSGNKKEENINQITMGLVFLHLLNNMDTIGEDSCQKYKDILADTALQYINKKYRDASLTELAASLNQSVSNMSKLIKKSTGYTFGELLQDRRFRQAVVFLADTDMTAAEIMNMVGYENSSYFYRKFRQKYGISPREYRSIQKDEWKIRT